MVIRFAIITFKFDPFRKVIRFGKYKATETLHIIVLYCSI